MMDITYSPNERYGDVLPNAPKKSSAQTIFEGEWVKSDGNAVYKFAGNTFELSTSGTHPLTNTKIENKTKGTFNITDRLNLYTTHSMIVSDVNTPSFLRGKWLSIKDKNAIYYTYSIEGMNLLLEVEGLSPQVTYTKR
jgi:hypothetical protein